MLTSPTRQGIFYIHLLRTLAATAVIAIHVLGPYREMYRQIPFHAWYSAVAINSLSRWAVPIFMMITGALLIRTDQQLQLSQFFRKRMLKVVVPFIGWSLIYLAIIAIQDGGDIARTALITSTAEPVWYHLWFFYEFIPLYLVVLLLTPLLARVNEQQLLVLISTWLTLTLGQLLNIPTPFNQSTILYAGYLVLGWYLFRYPSGSQLLVWVGAGVGGIVINLLGSWQASEAQGEYSTMFMEYTTLNTAVIAAMVFVLARQYGALLPNRLQKITCSISNHSLGIYVLHPVLLIPIRAQLENAPFTFGHPALAVPALTFTVLLLAWACTALLTRIPIIRRLVP